MSLPQPSSAPIRRRLELPAVDPLLAGAIALALIARIVFWAYTGRVWEDALITITHARNAVDGLGLVHHLGEGRVQGFTSGLSVLVPLAGEAIHSGGGLVALRLASLVAAVVTIIYAWRLAGLLELGRWPTAFVLVFLAADSQEVFFGM